MHNKRRAHAPSTKANYEEKYIILKIISTLAALDDIFLDIIGMCTFMSLGVTTIEDINIKLAQDYPEKYSDNIVEYGLGGEKSDEIIQKLIREVATILSIYPGSYICRSPVISESIEDVPYTQDGKLLKKEKVPCYLIKWALNK